MLAFPGEDWLRVGDAVVQFRLGRRDTAVASIETALRPQTTLDGAQRVYAAGMRARWLLEAMQVEIEAAVSKEDFAAAHAILVRYRERLGTDEDLSSQLDGVDRWLTLRELQSRHEAALSAHRKAEAKAIADQLLARPDLPGSLRRSLQEQSRKH